MKSGIWKVVIVLVAVVGVVLFFGFDLGQNCYGPKKGQITIIALTPHP